MGRRIRVALVGGGIGGLTAALALSRAGFEAHVFEQADRSRELGAGVTLTPNAVKVLRALGLGKRLAAAGFESEAIVGRDWTTRQSTFCVPLKGAVAARFGASHVDIHRADLLDILVTANSPSQIHLGHRCIGVSPIDRGAVLTFDSGKQEEFDLVVGCDGIHSLVRAALHGSDQPRFTANVCWRALIAAERLPREHAAPQVTIWTGPGGHIVTYYVRGGELMNVVAVRETTNWVGESWSIASTTSELLAAFPRVHSSLRKLLEEADSCFKWGLFDRDPLEIWSAQHVTLLGDAAHPMLPFLGQGAAMAMEDAYVLARELEWSPDDVAAALQAYEAERVPRTAQVQLAARKQAKIFHRTSPVARLKQMVRKLVATSGSDTFSDLRIEWLYGYDPTRQPT